MARILRRRVVQMPKVASGRRNLASEINQWLKLGLNAQQIIEKIIPDDPSVTPEMMDPVFDMMARRQGATAPLAERVARARQLAGIQEKQPSPEVPKSPSQGLGAPPRTPPGAAAIRANRAASAQALLDIAGGGEILERGQPVDPSAILEITAEPEEDPIQSRGYRIRDDTYFDQNTPAGPRPGRELMVISDPDRLNPYSRGEGRGIRLDAAIRAGAEDKAFDRAEDAIMARESKAKAKAEVSQSIQEAQIAENAAQLKSSFRQMYNAIKEGSGMYDFADNVQRAVPLFLRAAQASKASGDDVRLLQTIIRQSVRKAELADKQAGRTFKQKQFDAKVEETKRKEGVEADAEKLEWENKNDFQDKKTKDALRVAQEKGRQTRLNKKTRGTPATSQEQMLGKSTALDANKKIAAEEAKKIENKKELETLLKDPRIAKLIKPNNKGGFTALKKLDNHERKRLLPVYRLVGKIQGNDDIIKIQTAREKAAREQMANRADIDAIDRELGLDD